MIETLVILILTIVVFRVLDIMSEDKNNNKRDIQKMNEDICRMIDKKGKA